jgi:hypothetical protein
MSSEPPPGPFTGQHDGVGPGQLVDEWAAFAGSPERDHFYWVFNLRELLRLPPTRSAHG